MYDYSGDYKPYLNLIGTKEEMLEVIERLDFDYITLGIIKGKLFVGIRANELDPYLEKLINDNQPVVVHKKA